jgi:hypothetical protein
MRQIALAVIAAILIVPAAEGKKPSDPRQQALAFQREAKIDVRMADGEKVSGRLGEVGAEHFSIKRGEGAQFAGSTGGILRSTFGEFETRHYEGPSSSLGISLALQGPLRPRAGLNWRAHSIKIAAALCFLNFVIPQRETQPLAALVRFAAWRRAPLGSVRATHV